METVETAETVDPIYTANYRNNRRNNRRNNHRGRCGHCDTPGHNITKCQDQSLAALKSDIFNAFVFCRVVFIINNYIFVRYVSTWLEEKPIENTKAFYYYLFPRKRLENINNMNTVISEITYYYILTYRGMMFDELKQILCDIPDADVENIKSRYIEVYNRIVPVDHEMNEADINQICLTFRPLPVKFDIQIEYIPPDWHDPAIECPICLESYPAPNVVYLNCRHSICYSCILRYFMTITEYDVVDNNNGDIKCCTCRAPITQLYSGDRDKYNYIRGRHIQAGATPTVVLRPNIYSQSEVLSSYVDELTFCCSFIGKALYVCCKIGYYVALVYIPYNYVVSRTHNDDVYV